jgi:hypothetical protein
MLLCTSVHLIHPTLKEKEKETLEIERKARRVLSLVDSTLRST